MTWKDCTCKVCGRKFTPPLGSNKRALCGRCVRYKYRAGNARISEAQRVRKCGWCGCGFVKGDTAFKQHTGQKAGKYCSRACAKRDIQGWHYTSLLPECAVCGVRHANRENCNPRTELDWQECGECGERYVKRMGRTNCSDECAYAAMLRWNREKCWRDQFAIEIEWKQCNCGTWFNRPTDPQVKRRRLYCSLRCETNAANRRRMRRKRAAASVRYDDRTIFERDDWRCQMCGVRVRSMSGVVYHPTRATIDHIVPLSKGGEDAPWNVQCACSACNSIKGNRSAGSQLLLRFA